MPSIKTAISIEESLFKKVDELARELQVSRSSLFSEAVKYYVKRCENRKLLEKLNEVYSKGPEDDELEWIKQSGSHYKRIVEEQW